MATEMEFIPFKEFVKSLDDSSETPSADAKAIVCDGETDPVAVPANANALESFATESDMTEGSVVEFWTPNGKKKLDVTLLAFKSDTPAYIKDSYEHSVNLFEIDSPDNVDGKFVYSDGTLVDDEDYNSSGFIPVVTGETYSFSSKARSVCYYNGTTYVGYDTTVATMTIPNGANAIRFSATPAVWDSLMLVHGTEFPSSYVKGGYVLKTEAVPYPGIPDNYIGIDKVSFAENSANLFNKEDPNVALGKYLNYGVLANNSDYNSSGFIPVVAGDTYTFSSSARIVEFYNGISYRSQLENKSSVTIPEGCDCLRFSMSVNNWGTAMLVHGTKLPSEYVAYGKKISLDVIPDNPSPYIPDNYIGIDKVSFAENSVNLFNKDDPNVAFGKYLNYGVLANNENYNSSGYIQVTEGETYTLSSKARFIAIYNGTTYRSQLENKSSVTIPEGCNAIRFSMSVLNWNATMLVHGTQMLTEYVSYGRKIDANVLPNTHISEIIGGAAVESSMVSSSKLTTMDSVSSNDTIQVTDVPKDPKNGLYFSCRFNFSEFTSFKIGKGYDTYRGSWLELSATAIVCKRYEQAEITVGSVNHGLTLSDYISLAVSTETDGKWKVTLNTSTGLFTTEFQMNYEFSGTAFATFGSAATNVKLSFGDAMYRRPVWLFGDSYVGISSDNRWPYYIKTLGYLNIMMNGLAGRGSAAALSDFQKALAFGCPKVVLWCMGMNDTYSVWSSNMIQVKRLCEQNDIELVLTTIPTTPTQDKETISDAVRDSGLRYIDFYAAVGTNSSGEWYNGMLASDNVHPTALGAKALAAQVLVDFPEIVQYKD